MPTKTRASLTKNDLREAVYKAVPQLSREAVRTIVYEVFEEITEALVRDEHVKLRGFGRFKVHHKRSRPGRNPKTGEDFEIKARRSIKFAPSPFLSAHINGEVYEGSED